VFVPTACEGLGALSLSARPVVFAVFEIPGPFDLVLLGHAVSLACEPQHPRRGGQGLVDVLGQGPAVTPRGDDYPVRSKARHDAVAQVPAVNAQPVGHFCGACGSGGELVEHSACGQSEPASSLGADTPSADVTARASSGHGWYTPPPYRLSVRKSRGLGQE
jgi:hypothetical protein